MKIYLAADFARKEEMLGVQDVLTAIGHTITSQWINDPENAMGYGIGGSNLSTDSCSQRAKVDMQNLYDADMFLLFTTGNLSRGGRHTELGMALAWKKSICIIGPPEHVFHSLPSIRQYDNWPTFLLYQFREMFSNES